MLIDVILEYLEVFEVASLHLVSCHLVSKLVPHRLPVIELWISYNPL